MYVTNTVSLSIICTIKKERRPTVYELYNGKYKIRHTLSVIKTMFILSSDYRIKLCTRHSYLSGILLLLDVFLFFLGHFQTGYSSVMSIIILLVTWFTRLQVHGRMYPSLFKGMG